MKMKSMRVKVIKGVWDVVVQFSDGTVKHYDKDGFTRLCKESK